MLYSAIYKKVKQDEQLKNVSNDEIERRILGLSEFNKNPFSYDVDNPVIYKKSQVDALELLPFSCCCGEYFLMSNTKPLL